MLELHDAPETEFGIMPHVGTCLDCRLRKLAGSELDMGTRVEHVVAQLEAIPSPKLCYEAQVFSG